MIRSQPAAEDVGTAEAEVVAEAEDKPEEDDEDEDEDEVATTEDVPLSKKASAMM